LVTKEKAEEIQLLADIWKEELSGKLRTWCWDNGFHFKGYVSSKNFAEDLGAPEITPHLMRTVMNGTHIVADPLIYARIFVRTGLSESDPRTIPPQLKHPPRSEVVIKERRLEDDKYQDWQDQEEKKREREDQADLGETMGEGTITKVDQWKQDLAEALPGWYASTGYKASQLYGELDIRYGLWKHVAKGDYFVRDVEVYAKIFVRTGLVEADPRTIPLQEGGRRSIERAWTPNVFDAWYATEGKKYSADGASTEEVFESSTPSIVEEAVRGEDPLRRLFKEGVEYLAERLWILAMQEPGSIPIQLGAMTVESASKFLFDTLQKAARGSAEDRDELALQHGDKLFPVLELLSTLMKDSQVREVELKTNSDWRNES